MRYIGPFFRMSSLSIKDIEGQLFYLSRDSIKTLVLNSKCGILSTFRNSKKSSSYKDNLSILNNFSPLMCLYRKSSPNFIHSKNSKSFDENSFKKDINPTTNALMTMCLLELSDYYSNYKKDNRNVDSLEEAYTYLAKEQLNFYYENLRNSEGVFIEKKNISDNNSKSFNLIDKNKKFNFSDQAYMMVSYYMYYYYYKSESTSEEYKNFSLQILQMFIDFKDSLYNLSFSEGSEILFAFNIFYELSKEEDSKTLIIDLSDFLINKFDEKDYYTSSLDSCSLFSLTLLASYKHTDIISFKEKSIEIYNKLLSLYDSDKGIFLKLTDKKEIKYSALEICFYFILLLNFTKNTNSELENRNMISSLYKRYFITSGLVLSWPEAPTLDETERYRKLSLHSNDMLEESFFRMPNLPTPDSAGMAPIFAKNIVYSRKKDIFTKSKDSFDSNKNLFIFYIFIHYLSEDVIKEMYFLENSSNESDITLEQISESKDIPKDNSISILDESNIENNSSSIT